MESNRRWPLPKSGPPCTEVAMRFDEGGRDTASSFDTKGKRATSRRSKSWVTIYLAIIFMVIISILFELINSTI